MSANGWNVKGSTQQSWTSVPKVREGGHYFQDGPTYYLEEGGWSVTILHRYYDTHCVFGVVTPSSVDLVDPENKFSKSHVKKQLDSYIHRNQVFL